MEGSTLAKLSQERCAVSNRVAQVRRERSPGSDSGQPPPRKRSRKTAGQADVAIAEADLAGATAETGSEVVVQPRPIRPNGKRSGPVVAVTGAARGLGLALTARLASSAQVGRVVAIDDHRGDVSGVTWRVIDVRDPALAGRLAGVDVVVHTDLDLAPDSDSRARRAFNVRGAQTVLTAAAAGGVGRVVLVTSAMVYGASPENPVPMPEDSPLSAEADGSVVGDLLEIEHLARRSPRTHPGMEVTVARPAALVGDGVDTLITRHFEAPRLLAVKGCAARWQFCHVDDLVSALELAATGQVTGEFAVGCDGWLEQEQLEELSGMRRIELPAGLTFATAQRLHRAGITPAPVADLHYVVYPWVVDCKALHEAGWQPGYDNAMALEVLLGQRAGHHAVAGRRLGKKDATITAAGATVAVIGTAAIVRQVRRSRRGS
jgi:nucleoside-diphosphate-sugar epimerase